MSIQCVFSTKTMGITKIHFGHYVGKYGPWYSIFPYLLCLVRSAVVRRCACLLYIKVRNLVALDCTRKIHDIPPWLWKSPWQSCRVEIWRQWVTIVCSFSATNLLFGSWLDLVWVSLLQYLLSSKNLCNKKQKKPKPTYMMVCVLPLSVIYVTLLSKHSSLVVTFV